MDASQLTTEDHASADRAQQLLADRFHSAPSLYVQMRSWEYFVVGVEEGYDTTWVFEYHNDIACRDWLHEALPILTPAMRMFCLERLEPLDARYRAATGPVKSFDAQSWPAAGAGTVVARPLSPADRPRRERRAAGGLVTGAPPDHLRTTALRLPGRLTPPRCGGGRGRRRP